MSEPQASAKNGDAILPTLRPDLEILPGPTDVDGSPTFTVHDPLNGTYDKIGWAEAALFRNLRPGMTLAIEPMLNLGAARVRVLDDGWTVVTADGKPSAHFEHTVAVTTGDPEVLTCRARTRSESKAR